MANEYKGDKGECTYTLLHFWVSWRLRGWVFMTLLGFPLLPAALFILKVKHLQPSAHCSPACSKPSSGSNTQNRTNNHTNVLKLPFLSSSSPSPSSSSWRETEWEGRSPFFAYKTWRFNEVLTQQKKVQLWNEWTEIKQWLNREARDERHF